MATWEKNSPSHRQQTRNPGAHVVASRGLYSGHYLEAAIALSEVTGDETIYRGGVRAIDNMAAEFLDRSHPYASGHPNIDQALMRLYGITGSQTHLRLCGWLLEQRGRHEKPATYGRSRQELAHWTAAYDRGPRTFSTRHPLCRCDR
jgi:DUF1680 family protein